MSWHGFKKSIVRAGTSVLQAAGSVEKTVDKNFEDEERRYRLLESKIDRLYKETKKYLDYVRSIASSQRRIADHLQQVSEGDNGSFAKMIIEYQKIMISIDEDIRTPYDETYRVIILDPVMKYILFFNNMDTSIKKRSHKLLDYDAARSKVKKMIEKPSKDPGKLPKAEQKAHETKEIFDSIHDPLMEELPQLVAQSSPYLAPCWKAFLSSQYIYLQEINNRLSEIQKCFNTTNNGAFKDRNFNDPSWDQEIHSSLNELKTLTIVNPL